MRGKISQTANKHTVTLPGRLSVPVPVHAFLSRHTASRFIYTCCMRVCAFHALSSSSMRLCLSNCLAEIQGRGTPLYCTAIRAV